MIGRHSAGCGLPPDWSRLGDWLASASGAAAASAERRLLGAALADLGGTSSLSLGLETGAVGRGWRLAPCAADPSAAVPDALACALQLPLRNDSIDLIVAHHLFELSGVVSRQRLLLAELRRVLRPEGHLVVCEFDPLTPWGGGRWLDGCFRRLPAAVAPASARRPFDLPPAALLRQRLLAGGFSLLAGSRQRYWLGLRCGVWGGSYVLVARKRVLGVTPLRLQPLRRQRLAVGVAEPARAQSA